MNDELQQQINKRLTMNLLIQGAATHTFLTSHHIVADELDAISKDLTDFYDRLSISLYLCYWVGDLFLVVGRPRKFWRNVAKPGSPFCNHPFLVRHGRRLFELSHRFAKERARQKKVHSTAIMHQLQAYRFFYQGYRKEKPFRSRLAKLAKQTVSEIWGIDQSRLKGAITFTPTIGNIREPVSRIGKLLASGAAGWSGVEQTQNGLIVRAKAWFWPLLSHELVKGTAELICLHGLCSLENEAYSQVIDETDHIENEIWMIQTGGELYRMLLAARPARLSLANCFMHLSLMAPEALEQFVFDLVEDQPAARNRLEQFIPEDEGSQQESDVWRDEDYESGEYYGGSFDEDFSDED